MRAGVISWAGMGWVAAMLGILPLAAQEDVKDLAAAGFRKADARLNLTYGVVMKHLEGPKVAEDFVKAQRAWLVFRDAEAAYRAGVSSGGGSAYSMDFMAVQAELTDERVEQLWRASHVASDGLTKPIEGSISPNRRFAVAVGAVDGSNPKWEEVDRGDHKSFMVEGNAANYLVDVVNKRVITLLESEHIGTAQVYNHRTCEFSWSADNRWLALVATAKWESFTSMVYLLNPQGVIMERLDLLPLAEQLVAEQLKARFPKLSGEQLVGYQSTLSGPKMEADGSLQFNLAAEKPKADESVYLSLAVSGKVEPGEDGQLRLRISKVETLKEQGPQ